LFVFKTEKTTEIATLDVVGTSKTFVQPDKAEIYLSLETENESALSSQQRNAEIIADVRKAVMGEGLSADQIETSGYSVYPIRVWSEKEGKYQLLGYRTVHNLKLKATNISNVGRVIDAAVSAGANNVENIVFTLSDQRYEELKSQVLLNATSNAKAKAEAIATQMGIKLAGVYHVSEGYVSIVPIYKGIEMLQESSQVPTEISPGLIEVSASISTSYKIA
jgi:uncharacterized protein YggE